MTEYNDDARQTLRDMIEGWRVALSELVRDTLRTTVTRPSSYVAHALRERLRDDVEGARSPEETIQRLQFKQRLLVEAGLNTRKASARIAHMMDALANDPRPQDEEATDAWLGPQYDDEEMRAWIQHPPDAESWDGRTCVREHSELERRIAHIQLRQDLLDVASLQDEETEQVMQSQLTAATAKIDDILNTFTTRYNARVLNRLGARNDEGRNPNTAPALSARPTRVPRPPPTSTRSPRASPRVKKNSLPFV